MEAQRRMLFFAVGVAGADMNNTKTDLQSMRTVSILKPMIVSQFTNFIFHVIDHTTTFN